MIVIGASLGGTTALREILRGLAANFPLPIAVVLHRHRDSDGALLDVLRKDCRIPLREACDKDRVEPGVTLAPSDYHLMIDGGHYSLSVDEPVQFARPSIDVLFESAADACAERTIAVILTGANQDGARGAAKIRERGGTVIVQDPATAESPTMPAAAIELAGADHIVPLQEIAGLLERLAAARPPPP